MIFIILALVVIFLLVGGSPKGNMGNQKPIACTMDAKICPDGSAVGREGPLCEFAACPSDGRVAAGYITGHVSIGPFCPVEQVDRPCTVPPEAYTSRSVIVYEEDGITERDRIALDTEGNYTSIISPGIYWIQIEPAGIGPGEKKQVTVISFETTIVNFDIDTGIR